MDFQSRPLKPAYAAKSCTCMAITLWLAADRWDAAPATRILTSGCGRRLTKQSMCLSSNFLSLRELTGNDQTASHWCLSNAGYRWHETYNSAHMRTQISASVRLQRQLSLRLPRPQSRQRTRQSKTLRHFGRSASKRSASSNCFHADCLMRLTR